MKRARQIIALGGGGFSMEDSPWLDDYLVAAAGVERARVCFLPTASGDSEDYVGRFYQAFGSRAVEATHLSLFRRSASELREQLLAQDVIYVGGGNTANMLAVWRLHGVDVILREAWEAGIVLAGVSAGAICWFDEGVTDSFGPALAPLTGCMGLVAGSFCPHYDGEERRRPVYSALVASGQLAAGFAADDGAAVHFRDDEPVRAVSSRPNARVYRVAVDREGTAVDEMPTTFLGGAAP